MGSPPPWLLGEVLTIPRSKNVSYKEMLTKKATDLDRYLDTN
jgi:hypothetical protein